jgi:hypothetical protein
MPSIAVRCNAGLQCNSRTLDRTIPFIDGLLTRRATLPLPFRAPCDVCETSHRCSNSRSAVTKRSPRTSSPADYHHDHTPDWSWITVPLLSAGNWGGMGAPCAATRADSNWRHQPKNVSRCTTRRTGRCCTRSTDRSCRSVSSGTSSRVRTPAGATNPGCSGGRRRRGRCPRPSRPGWTWTATTVRCARSRRPPRRRQVRRPLVAGLPGSAPKTWSSRVRWPPSCTWKAPAPTRTPSWGCGRSRPRVWGGIPGGQRSANPIAQGWLRASHRALDTEQSRPPSMHTGPAHRSHLLVPVIRV